MDSTIIAREIFISNTNIYGSYSYEYLEIKLNSFYFDNWIGQTHMAKRVYVIAHEIGHALGLPHLPNNYYGSLMKDGYNEVDKLGPVDIRLYH